MYLQADRFGMSEVYVLSDGQLIEPSTRANVATINAPGSVGQKTPTQR